MPKQTIFLETPVFLFSLLKIFDGIFDVIIDDPYLTQQKDSAKATPEESFYVNLLFMNNPPLTAESLVCVAGQKKYPSSSPPIFWEISTTSSSSNSKKDVGGCSQQQYKYHTIQAPLGKLCRSKANQSQAHWGQFIYLYNPESYLNLYDHYSDMRIIERHG